MSGLREDLNLRAWQAQALDRWTSAGCRGIVEVVTGGGKTVFALAAADRWLRSSATSERLMCIIVPTTALQDQWFVSLLGDFGVSERDISIWPAQPHPERPFHILVVNTARSAMTTIAAAGHEILLVADECHRYASPMNRRALVGTEASLGLSATARREHDSGYEDVLVPALGPTVYTYGLDQAREDGVISPFVLVNIQVEFDDEEQSEYDSLSRRIAVAVSEGEEDLAMRLALLRASVSKRAAMRLPVAVSAVEQYRGARALVFHEDIKSANAIVDLLASRGHSAAGYHTGMGGSLRRDNLRQFRNGWIDVLVCCRALDEGIDVPEAQLAVIAASTSSQRQRIQRLGRVLRPSAHKELARVVTIYVTPHEQQRLLTEQALISEVADVTWQRAAF